MGSTYPPGLYDEQSLQLIEGVFRQAWETLAGTVADPQATENFRAVVVNRLLDLVGQGISDPEELRDATLTHFNGQAASSS